MVLNKTSHVFAMRKQLAGIPGPDMLHFIQHIKSNQVANGKKQFNTHKELADKYYFELGGSDKPNINDYGTLKVKYYYQLYP